MTHDRDGWPDGTPDRLINGIYRLEPRDGLRAAARKAVETYYNAEDADDDDRLLDAMRDLRSFWTWHGGYITGDALDSQPPYADLEQCVPEAWAEPEPASSFRRGFAWGCGTEIALGLLILVIAFLLGYIK